ncbi:MULTISPECIES: hypothetical protein [unclassified Streptomyces]|uniref:hypothetical protein n=1 Tax=unclassified Streptomyces TaxID=2593676 RepID=UPI00081F5576|nr:MULTISPECIES: hypothetical protein [unclassified Streptomyces]MYR93383.1 hypothetical protein [Streptomyces sp. SID4937]SCD51711.1 hypothetical protein GA0115243_102547 [Streptomyces sp. ScaeMP-e83]
MASRYDPAHGWRLDRIPGRNVEQIQDEDGSVRVVVPLMILLNGRWRGDSDVWLTRAEAEALHAELGRTLAGEQEKQQACEDAPAHSFAGRR